LEKVGESGLLLRVRPHEPYGESEFHFEPGDRLLLYTDGLAEAENASGESFGEAALPACISDKQHCGTEQFVELLLEEVLAWSPNGQEDDITIRGDRLERSRGPLVGARTASKHRVDPPSGT
jgi:serine phosphatase RsbU (regulator of sigma subunit)